MPILGYQVWYDQAVNSFVSIAFVQTLSYTLAGLTPGNTYQIKVQAQNSVGFSGMSNTVSILAA